MLDLRKYKEVVKEAIKEVSERDQNWKWKIKSCKKVEIQIEWGYLTYLDEKRNCFFIELEAVEADDSDEIVCYWLWARKPDGRMIDCWDIEPDGKRGKGPCPSLAIEDALKYATSRIINHALDVY